MSKNLHTRAQKAAFGLVAAIATILSLQGYASATSYTVTSCSKLADIVASTASGDTVTLTEDCSVALSITSGQNLTIDLAGHTLLTSVDNGIITVASGATLNLVSSAAGASVESHGRDVTTGAEWNAVINAGTLNVQNVTLWGDVTNSGTLNLESVTFDPEDYYPYPTYTIHNTGTITTSGSASRNLFKSTPVEGSGSAIATNATFNLDPTTIGWTIGSGATVTESGGQFIVSTGETSTDPDASEDTSGDTSGSDTTSDSSEGDPADSAEPLGET